VLVSGEDAARAARERVVMHNAEGLGSRWVDPEQAASLLPLLDPAHIDGATYADLDGAIDPPRNVTAYVRAMRDTGVALHEHTPATGLELAGPDGSRRVTGVVTPHGTIATDRVVLAGGVDQPALGAWTGARAVVGGARHLVAVTSPHPSMGPDMVMGFDLAAGLYWRAEEGGILFGASNPDELPGEATSIDWDHLAATRRRLAELVPLTGELDLRRVWSATIDFTPDHLPIIGPARGPDGEAVAGVTLASAGGHGMMWGPGGQPLRRRPGAHRRHGRDRRLGPRGGPVRRRRPLASGHRPRRPPFPEPTPVAPASA
jgi:sarcosine oxidase subunit beta